MELVLLGVLAALNLGALILFVRAVHHVPPDRVLIVTTPREVRVVRRAALIFPGLRSETLDLSDKRITIDRRGSRGAHTRDDLRVDVTAEFTVRPRSDDAAILALVTRLGCDRASSAEALASLYTARFETTLRTQIRQLDFAALMHDRSTLISRVHDALRSEDLGGLEPVAVAVPHLTQTPLELLDRDHILDAVAIATITEQTLRAREHLAARERDVRLAELAARMHTDALRDELAATPP